MTIQAPRIEDRRIDLEVFSCLPQILQDACSVFDREADRETFLHGALPALSRVLPNGKIILADKEHRLSLYVYAYGSSGSGKGAAGDALQLLEPLLRRESEQNMRAQRDYEQQLKVKDEEQQPAAPPQLVDMHIPLRTTPSTLVRRIGRNPDNTVLLLADTEGHALGNPTHKDHGSIRQIMLKGAEGERDGQLWKDTGMEQVQCWLSMLITSTPQQMLDAIGSTEDGLFSRFVWYRTAPSGGQFRDPRPGRGGSRRTRLHALGDRVLKIYDVMNAASSDVVVTFSKQQYDEHRDNMQALMDEAYDMSHDLDGAVGRLGNSVMRTAAVFALLREAESRQRMPQQVACDELSWSAAVHLSRVWLESMLEVHNMFHPRGVTEVDETPPKLAADLIRSYLVERPRLKPTEALRLLRAERQDGLTMWLKTLKSERDSVRKIINGERSKLQGIV